VLRVVQPLRVVDIDLSESIEMAWARMSVKRVEKQLLRGFFIWRMSPRRLALRPELGAMILVLLFAGGEGGV
jgi:hypothetical protein